MPRLLDRVLGSQHPEAVKVPLQITVLFWGTKIASTAFGEAFADWLDGASNVVVAALGSLVALAAFAFALRRQFGRSHYDTASYWFAVAMVATFGTMLADVVHQFTGAPYWSTTLLYGVILAVVLWRWWSSEGTLSIHSIDSRRRERFYWATVLATFALGTATGDWTAGGLRLDYLPSGLLFLGLILVPAVAYRLGANAVLCFWTAYVLTRPLGASFADWLDNPASNHGVGLGRPLVWAVFGVLMIAGVVTIAAYERRQAPVGRHENLIAANEAPNRTT